MELPVAMSPPVKVWSPLQTGTIAWERAGAASLRIAVEALPFMAERPREAVGFAKPLKETRQVPEIAKQPFARLMPFPAEVVAFPRVN